VCATALALPAAATPGDDHKVTICHVTNSEKNPYVMIEVDFAAFDGEGVNDHKRHENKSGDVDVEFDFVTGLCDDGGTSGGDGGASL
jgi:hypothetical protein